MGVLISGELADRGRLSAGRPAPTHARYALAPQRFEASI
jgi:hypothetical protein